MAKNVYERMRKRIAEADRRISATAVLLYRLHDFGVQPNPASPNRSTEMTPDEADYRIIRENVESPYTPFHRATYGLSYAEYVGILHTSPPSMFEKIRTPEENDDGST